MCIYATSVCTNVSAMSTSGYVHPSNPSNEPIARNSSICEYSECVYVPIQNIYSEYNGSGDQKDSFATAKIEN